MWPAANSAAGPHVENDHVAGVETVGQLSAANRFEPARSPR